MTATASTDIRQRLEQTYRRRTPGSRAEFERALRFLPGGTTRGVVYHAPYPLFAHQGSGAYFTDLDGNRYLDLLNNYTSLIHGHAHPEIGQVVREQLQRGTAFATGLRCQTELAGLLVERVPSVDMCRFMNSGTEATLFAIRLAKAYTRRNKLIKIEGGYHGTHDPADISMYPDFARSGPPDAPIALPTSEGVFRGIVDDVLVIPYSNVEAAGKVIRDHRKDLAAVILEPALGGTIAARPGYLEFLRAATSEVGALLVFDEVVTYRLGPAGAQGILGIEPDLTAFGKIIGGGFPVGAVGGRREVMSLMDTRNPRVPHSGTFNGNPVTMVAGLKTLELLTEAAYEHLNRLGDRLRIGLRQAFQEAGIDAQVLGAGSLIGLFFSREPVVDARTGSRADETAALLHLALLNRGVFIAPRGIIALSTVTTETDIEYALESFRGAIAEIPR